VEAIGGIVMADGKRYYWLKLYDDFFGSMRIKKLRKIAGGDTYLIIYLKMQLKAMKTGGVLEYTGLEDSFAEELALDLDEEADNVAITVNYLLSCGLMETSDQKEYFVPYAVLNTGSESASTQRVREHRAKKALQCNTDETQVKRLCSVEKEKEKEIEIEIEKREKIGYQRIADMYNETCVSFPRLKSLSDSRKKAIKARMNTYSEDDFKLLFEKAEASSFLKGKNNRNWTATFDWLIKDANMAKVLDGNYDEKSTERTGSLDYGNPEDFYK
jgi:predicted phage replisome organizer